MIRVPRLASLALALAAVALPPTLLAQGGGARPLGTDTTGRWDLAGSLRVRAEQWRWFDGTERGRYAYGAATLRLGVERSTPRQGFRLELEAPALFGLPDDAAVGAPVAGTYGPGAGQLGQGATYYVANDSDRTDAQLFPKQLYWRLTSRRLSTTTTLRVGRWEFSDGAETAPASATLLALKQQRISQRLLGPFAWTHVGRAFDGVHWSRKRDGRDLTLLVAAPTRGVFQADGWGPLPIGIGYGAWTVPYSHGNGSADARVFALQYVDTRDDIVKTDNRPAPVRAAEREGVSVTTLGGHWLYAHQGASASWDVLLWGAGQVGSWGAQSHRAWSGVAELGVQPGGLPSLNPWLRVGYAHGSGDGDAADDVHGTFFQVLPTPRPYARFPFYDMQNMADAYGSLTLRPSPRVTLRSEVHALRLANAADLWYLGGGAFQRKSFGYQGRASGGERALSVLADVSADVRVTPDFTVSAYLSRATAGEAMRVAYPGKGAGALLYLEVVRSW